MTNVTLYMAAKQNVEAKEDTVLLEDVASVFCEDKVILAKANAMKLYRFRSPEKKRAVISVLKIIEQLSHICPGITVESLGEKDIIVERSSATATRQSARWLKIGLVAFICFFGTAFTIMAFHNDVGITDVFRRIYLLVTGENSDGCTIIEITYSIGLFVGIVTFYNHFGGKRLSTDPTPLEVEMRNYERDVNMALVEIADREGKERDVDE